MRLISFSRLSTLGIQKEGITFVSRILNWLTPHPNSLCARLGRGIYFELKGKKPEDLLLSHFWGLPINGLKEKTYRYDTSRRLQQRRLYFQNIWRE